MEGKEVDVKKKGSSQKLPQFVRHYGIIHYGIRLSGTNSERKVAI